MSKKGVVVVPHLTVQMLSAFTVILAAVDKTVQLDHLTVVPPKTRRADTSVGLVV